MNERGSGKTSANAVSHAHFSNQVKVDPCAALQSALDIRTQDIP